jgi:trk system potassium uptake protein TrkA
MRTIVIGAGEVGFHIAERLSREDHDVVVIERDPATRDRVQDVLDVLAVEGNGASPRVLEEAGVREADLLIAVADIDEVNIAACVLAREYGVSRRIARVRNPDFSESPFLEQGKRLGIDLLINPDLVVADAVLTLIQTPAAAEVGKFAGGKVMMLGIQIGAGAPIVDRPLRTLKPFHTTTPFLIVALFRHGKILIPDGKTVVEDGDHLYFISKRESIHDILTLLGKRESLVGSVLLIGGGRIGSRIAHLLEREHLHIKLIERRTERCEELSRLLQHTLVLQGDGTDIRSLLQEGVSGMDAVVAVTDDEATNILATLLAKEQGAKKAIALIKRPHLVHLLPHLGIDAAISPRISTANVILRYVRKGTVVSIFELPESDAETLEMVVSPGAKVAGKALREIGTPSGVIVGAIIHGAEIIIPKGDSVLQPDDRVVVFALPGAIADLERLFA